MINHLQHHQDFPPHSLIHTGPWSFFANQSFYIPISDSVRPIINKHCINVPESLDLVRIEDVQIHYVSFSDLSIIREIISQFDVPTSLTPVLTHLLCFHFVGCVKEVINSINLLIVSLLDTREYTPEWVVQVQRWFPSVSI
jgi:hypothetical protein